MPARRTVLKGAGALGAASVLSPFRMQRRPGRRVLALGDSYTVGTGVDTDERWLTELVDRLRADGFALADPVVVAEAGWTTADLAAGIEAASPGGPYDLVTLLVGANDAIAGRPPDAFRGRFEALLARAVAFAAGEPDRVVVLTVPDYTVTPAGQLLASSGAADRLESYNRVVRDAAADRGTRLVDVVPVSRAVADDPSLVADDGLHPSATQHDRWLARVYPAAVAALSE